jgi:crossover junction endodeoxyribonuclease RuvC
MAPVSFERIILGVDPGTQILGYGVIGCNGKRFEMLDLGVLRLEKVRDHAERLKRIHIRMTELILLHSVSEMALEAPFFGKNVQSMLKLGRAQGVAIGAALDKDVEVFEYSPRKIKQSVTGNGSASKEQVAAILQQLMSIDVLPEKFDATDGLAASVCHFFQADPGKIGRTQNKKNAKKDAWAKFISNNPKRLL